jgi:F-type H+-transporting ATPase subunit b
MTPYLLAADDSTPSPLLPHLSEVLVGLVAFAVLFFILQRFALPRFEQVFLARRDAIEGGMKRAEEAQARAQQALEQYRAQLADARAEAAQIRDNARAEGQRIIEEMRTTAQEESARIVARGDEQLTLQRQQVVLELRGEIGTLATSLAERMVGESLADDAARRRTIDRFLDDLDGMAGSVPAGVGAGLTGDAPAAGGADPGADGRTGSGGSGSSDPAGGAANAGTDAGTVSPSGTPVADPPVDDRPAGATRADDEGSGGGRSRRRR